MRSAARVAATAALSLALLAGAFGPATAQTAPTAGALSLSPRTFDGDSGLLQLDVKVSVAPSGSRLLVAFRFAPRGAAQQCEQQVTRVVSSSLQLGGERTRRAIVLVRARVARNWRAR
jgi:hypothetical protein